MGVLGGQPYETDRMILDDFKAPILYEILTLHLVKKGPTHTTRVMTLTRLFLKTFLSV